MKKVLFAVLVAMLIQTAFAGAAGAAYKKEWDKRISINTGHNLTIPIDTGKLSFELQEAVHNELTDSTGIEVDHFYLWVELDGQDILGVDPAKVWY